MDRIDTRGNAGDGKVSLFISDCSKWGAHDRYGCFCDRLPKVGIDHLPSNSAELLAEDRGVQSQAEKRKLDSTPSGRSYRERKNFFDA